MSGFGADWLADRRPHDMRSRAPLPGAFSRFLNARPRPLRVADLGTGTGANAAALQPLLGVEQEWRLIEHDPALIAAASPTIQGQWRALDLAADLGEALDGPLDLITGSALLDLVSAGWLDSLVAIGRAKKAAMHFALSYDGLQAIRPALPFDVEVATLFHRHQRTDKGFGPALGNTATACLREKLADAGYLTVTAGSPWVLGPQDSPFAARVLQGLAAPALEMAPDRQDDIQAWLDRRLAEAKAGGLHLTIGHQDLFAWPAV